MLGKKYFWRRKTIENINEKTLVSEILNFINEENVIIAPGQGEKTVLILSYEFCEEQAFPDLLPTGKFVNNAPNDILISFRCVRNF